MTKKIKKKNTNLPKKYSKDDAMDFVYRISKDAIGPEPKLEKLTKEGLGRLYSGKSNKEDNKILNTLVKAYSLETGVILAESVIEEYRELSFEAKRQFEKEYECKKPSEKALVDQIVNCYIRKLYYSRTMLKYDGPSYLDNNHVGLLNFYSKEIDKAHRQFISGLETLRAMKQPEMKFNIKTKETYIAQNQQINNKDKNNVSK